MPRKDHLPRQTGTHHAAAEPQHRISCNRRFRQFFAAALARRAGNYLYSGGFLHCHALGPHKDRPSGSISADQFRAYPHGALSVHGKPLDSDADSGCVPCELSA